MRLCGEHEFLSYVERDDGFCTYPINMEDINRMPDNEKIKEEMKDKDETRMHAFHQHRTTKYWVASVGETLYSKIVKNYTEKMWQINSCTELDTFKWSPKGVQIKEGGRAAWDTAISGYPISETGYDEYFAFATKNTKVLLNTKVKIKDIEKKLVILDGEEIKFDIIVSTIGPDVLLNHELGKLKYVGRKLHLMVMPGEYIFP